MLFNVLKGLHILAIIAWMAGLLYLPRLFAYHTRAPVGSETDRTFIAMEARLLRIIMNPSVVAVIVLGSILVWLDGWRILQTPWMMLKLAGVLFLLAWHHYLSVARRGFALGRRVRSERFWRLTNELPFIAAAVIVLSVTTKFGT